MTDIVKVEAQVEKADPSLYYDREGRPISVERWSELWRDMNYRIVKQETLWSGIRLSSVWLGLNHNFGLGDPMIFETMAFAPFTSDDLGCFRAGSEEQILKAHQQARSQLWWRGIYLAPLFFVKRVAEKYRYKFLNRE